MIAENVKGLVSHDGGNTLKTILNTLNHIGYNNYYKVLNSCDFGVPQSRERLFIVSIRKDIDFNEFSLPTSSSNNNLYLKDIIDYKDTNRKNVKKSLQKYMNPNYFTKDYFSQNGIRKLFDGCSEGYFTSSFSSNRIFSIEGNSPTLTTKNDAVFFEINGHLTQKERFALQGFKKEYADLLIKNGISKGNIDKMSGNSITVNVVCEILKKLLLNKENS